MNVVIAYNSSFNKKIIIKRNIFNISVRKPGKTFRDEDIDNTSIFNAL